MNETILQLTLREMTKSITSSKFWIGLFGVICVLAISAPFDSGKVFNLVQRFFYWGAIAITTYFIGFFINVTVSLFIQHKTGKRLLSRIVSSLLAGIAVGIWVYFINAFVLAVMEPNWKDFSIFTLTCIAIAGAVSALMFILNDTIMEMEDRAKNQVEAKEQPVFYKRLPKSIGTDIISLNAQDHYVEVTTILGKELVLIRLSDAIAELGDIQGQQIHRSWWVSKKHVADTKRKNGRLNVILSNQNEIAVSRSFLDNTKQLLAIK